MTVPGSRSVSDDTARSDTTRSTAQETTKCVVRLRCSRSACEAARMGILHYGGADFEIDDRTLAHLKVVVAAKLRRKETVLISWNRPVQEGSGRVELLIFPEAPIVFRFQAGLPPRLNRVWLQVLQRLAGEPEGIRVISEEDAELLGKSRDH